MELTELMRPPAESPYPEGAAAIAYADGASRGNPGDAAYGCVFATDDDLPLCGEGVVIEKTTNNVAEYRGFVAALERLKNWGVREATVRLDSELIVKQFNGQYRVRQPHLKPYHAKARQLAEAFDRLTVEHVRRNANKLADALANAALDGKL